MKIIWTSISFEEKYFPAADKLVICVVSNKGIVNTVSYEVV
jgi:hypothetical protein